MKRAKARTSAPESAQQQLGESPDAGRSCSSVVEGNCVVERRGGEQPETNNQSVINKIMNSIRFQREASLLVKGEAREMHADPWRARRLHRTTASSANAQRGLSRMVGDRMVGSCCDVNRGSRPVKEAAFMTKGSEEPRTGGDRVPVGAKKVRNGTGAKGDVEDKA